MKKVSRNRISKKRTGLLFVLGIAAALLACGTIAFAETSDCPICINEICADEDAGGTLHRAYDDVEADGYYDWLELYNTGSAAAGTKDLYLTDKESKLTEFALPDIEIPAKGYVVVYCGKAPAEPADGEIFTGFAVSKKSETVYLTDGETVLDSMTVTAAATNRSFSRSPDGSEFIAETTATPGSKNTYVVAGPVLSRESGFYDEFDLSMSSGQEGTSIYYTLDGSDPTGENAILYTEPIRLTDASSKENVCSARTDISPYTSQEIKKKYSLGGLYDPPGNVDKHHIVKAVCMDNEGNASWVVQAAYFIGLDKSEYSNLPIICLEADYDDLFAYENGIYVLGKKFDKYAAEKLDNAAADDSAFQDVIKWNGNFSRDRSIEGGMFAFESSKSSAEYEPVTLEMKGGATRSLPQKSFSIKGRKNFVVFNGGNDYIYKMKEPAISEIAQGLNFTQSEYKPCQVFLNGEYWGLYYTQESLFTKEYYSEKYNVSKSSIAIIKLDELNDGTEQDLNDFRNLKQYVIGNDMSKGANYEHFCEQMDVSSLIDYYCTEMFIANYDWPANNWAVWRSSELDNKWRYILYDTNYGSCVKQYYYDMLDHVLNRDDFFKSLYCNTNFRKAFLSRMQELLGSNFSTENTVASLTKVYNEGRPYIQANFDRYYSNMNWTVTEYDKDYDEIREFLKKRGSFMRWHINETNEKMGYLERISANRIRVPDQDISLNKSAFAYNGKAQRPTVNVTDLRKGTDYTVTYSSGCKNVGKYNVRVVTKGTRYKGTYSRSFVINPKGTSISSLTKYSKAFKVTWKKQSAKMSKSRITGYQVQYATNSKFTSGKKTVTIKGYGSTSRKISGLKSGKKYYVRVRTYVKTDGGNLYSSWSAVKTVTAK